MEIRIDVVLAVILPIAVAVAGQRIEPETILGVLVPRTVRTRRAVPVTQVDEEVGALGCRLDPAPRRVRAVDLDHGRTVGAGLRGITFRAIDVVRGIRFDGPDDDHDLEPRCGCRDRVREAEGGRQHECETEDHGSGRSMTGRPLGAVLDWQRSCLLSAGTPRGGAR